MTRKLFLFTVSYPVLHLSWVRPSGLIRIRIYSDQICTWSRIRSRDSGAWPFLDSVNLRLRRHFFVKFSKTLETREIYSSEMKQFISSLLHYCIMLSCVNESLMMDISHVGVIPNIHYFRVNSNSEQVKGPSTWQLKNRLSMYLSIYLSIYGCTAICWTLPAFSVSLDGGSARRKAATYTQNNTHTE
jgi:hypothetical protein